MKYSDKQRIQKIYENAEKLQNYIYVTDLFTIMMEQTGILLQMSF